MAAATNYADQIMELEAQKQAIMTKAKTEYLTAAQKAVEDLNNLGFNYKLVEGGGSAARNTSNGTDRATRSPRKGGISEQVLAVIKEAAEGMSRAGVLAAMNADDTKAEQSISNALSNLKKKGQLTAENGVYKAA